MQTFLPYSDFIMIAKCLDDKRLNKQILECDVLIDLIDGVEDNSWKNHPAYRMWVDYPNSLIYYRNVMLKEWMDRGKNSNRKFRIYNRWIIYPDFIYDQRVILSHRSNLMRKFPEHYNKFGWVDYGIVGYFWPCEVKTPRSKKINEQWTRIVYG